MTRRNYQRIDSDGHVLEPVDMWARYIDAKYRERVPRFSTDAAGNEVVQYYSTWSETEWAIGLESYRT